MCYNLYNSKKIRTIYGVITIKFLPKNPKMIFYKYHNKLITFLRKRKKSLIYGKINNNITKVITRINKSSAFGAAKKIDFFYMPNKKV